MNTNRTPNRLLQEKSPYLLQHAYNPVDWFPWGEEAFAKAKAEDKPIFLSIGYSTCHWCHVMERESFEDEQVAEALNKGFVSIKVDKEERPDIDSVYMTVCQALTGQGGWPMTILMNHDQKPFFAGTYFPKRARYGMPGMLELLAAIDDKWKNDRESLLESGEEITRLVGGQQLDASETLLSKEEIHGAKEAFAGMFDPRYGGFGRAPKFPTPHNLMFLLRYARQAGDAQALSMVEKTLEQMYRGGIFDHVGYGFSRYSTDQKWLAPHFEKMLYDNALLIMAYSEAYQLTRRPLYRQVAIDTIEYILREMTSPEGGFYCAQDADSEGEEGKYYLLTYPELLDLLGEEDAKAFSRRFGVTNEGNFESKNIPSLIDNPDFEQEPEHIRQICQKVYEYRAARMSLHKDDKLLTSWNALMIAALAKAYQALGDPRYLVAAQKAAAFVQEHLSNGAGRLWVRYRQGHRAGDGHLDDYAFYVWALLELYRASFRPEYLESALRYHESMLERFWDEDSGGLYFSARDSEALIFRPKESYDGAIPSGNSVAAFNLITLAKLTGSAQLEETAHRQLCFLSGAAQHYPAGHSFALIAVMSALYPSKELVCAAVQEQDAQALRKALGERFLPEVFPVVLQPQTAKQLTQTVPAWQEYTPRGGETTYYLCQNHACAPPVQQLEQILEQLN